MASTINGTSTGSGGLISTGDDSGILNIQTNETTAITVDASQRVAFVAGTAALPAITTAGDTNTGIYFPAADTIAFSEGGAESMRINASGNVGIGSTSPSAFGGFKTLAIGGDSGSSTSGVLQFINNGTEGLRIVEGSTAVEIIENRNIAMVLGTNATERMRITSGGNFGIGTTTGLNSKVTLYSDCNALTAMEIRDTGTTGGYLIAFYNSSSNLAGGIIHNGTTTVNYSTSSDYRMKENIAPMTGALSKVALLKPVTYKWKEEFGGESGQGFIAHELQAVVPEAVAGAKDALNEDGSIKPQGIDTSFLVATLTAAIQEQQALITAQAETINALTARIVALEQA
jgi:hypothetical protein